MHIRTSSVMILNQRHWQLLGGHWQHGKGVDRLCEKMSFQMVCRDVLWCAELYCGVQSCTAIHRVPRRRMGERPLDIEVSCEISGFRPDE